VVVEAEAVSGAVIVAVLFLAKLAFEAYVA